MFTRVSIDLKMQEDGTYRWYVDDEEQVPASLEYLYTWLRALDAKKADSQPYTTEEIWHIDMDEELLEL